MSDSDLKKEINHEIQSSGAVEGSKKRIKYLIFSLAGENYGISLSSVKEVIGLTEVTPVPHVPKFFKGLINLRGKIISVIDLREKLALSQSQYESKKTSIIIVEIGDITLGAVVDDVEEVVGFEAEQIEDTLDIQSTVSREFITGVAKTSGKRLVLLLDIGKALSVDELNLVRNKTQNS